MGLTLVSLVPIWLAGEMELDEAYLLFCVDVHRCNGQ